MDLSVGELLVKRRGSLHTVDPYNQSDIDSAFGPPLNPPVALGAGEGALIVTKERVEGLSKMLGLVFPRSTWARLGLLAGLGVVDPGFSGRLTLPVFNASACPLLIRAGDRMWQLEFVLLDEGSGQYKRSRYSERRGVALPIALSSGR